MKVAVFSTHSYDRRFLDEASARDDPRGEFELVYQDTTLSSRTAALAEGCGAVCAFVNDTLDEAALEALSALGVRTVLLRCAGFNNVDLEASRRLGMAVSRVPAYSPEGVAEHAIALIMTLNRQTHRAYNRVRDGNFMLDGLLGFTLHGKTVGIVGTGKIGLATARILKGFGCDLLGCDPYPTEDFAGLGQMVDLPTLLAQSDVVTLHCPLTDATRHMLNADTLARMKPGAMLVNTSRGALLETGAVIDALKARRLGSLALDVYEQEGELFYHDRSSDIIEDDVFQRLMTFPNVLVTGHQGFFTVEAMREIAGITFRNLRDAAAGIECPNRVPGS